MANQMSGLLLAALRHLSRWAWSAIRFGLPALVAALIYSVAVGYYGFTALKANTDISAFGARINIPDLEVWVFVASSVLALLYIVCVGGSIAAIAFGIRWLIQKRRGKKGE